MSDVTPVVPVPYDWKLGLRKGLSTFVQIGAAMWVALYPLLEEKFANEGAVAALLPPRYVAFAGVIAGAVRVWANYRKQTKV